MFVGMRNQRPAERKESSDERDDSGGSPSQKRWLDVGSAPPIVRCQSILKTGCCVRQGQPSLPDRVGDFPACQDSVGFDPTTRCPLAFDIEERKRSPSFDHVIKRAEGCHRTGLRYKCAPGASDQRPLRCPRRMPEGPAPRADRGMAQSKKGRDPSSTRSLVILRAGERLFREMSGLFSSPGGGI
jgi:hypothetical protein